MDWIRERRECREGEVPGEEKGGEERDGERGGR